MDLAGNSGRAQFGAYGLYGGRVVGGFRVAANVWKLGPVGARRREKEGMRIQDQNFWAVTPNVMAPPCYLGLDENTPLGSMFDLTFNLMLTTPAGSGVSPWEINISCSVPWFMTGIYLICETATVSMRPYDGQGEEIWTDFRSLFSSTADSEPFPMSPPYPFEPNDNLRFQIFDDTGGHVVEALFRGYTLG